MGSGLFGRLEQELDAREKSPGLTMSDVLTMPDAQRRLVGWMIREREVNLEAAAAHLGQDTTAVRALLAAMIEKGFVVELEMQGVVFYRIRLAAKRGRDVPLDIWASLEEQPPEP